MNPAHIHLLLNHIPILGSLFGTILLAIGLVRKDKSLLHAGLLTLVIVSIISVPAFFSGEGAEEMIEKMPDISHDVIHEHEEIAEKAIWLMELVGLASLIAFFLHLKEHPLRYTVTIVVLVLAIANFGVMAKVGNTGGEIRHTEIRKEVIPTNTIEKSDDD
ncbi:MAG: hypothetical protein OHK0038_01980 [Flammeovirgaceae bacterium]